MNYEEVGERIRNIRETDLKITREEFAEEIGVSVDTASRLENANKKIKNVETYLKIAELTGLTMEELLLGKEDTSSKQRLKKRINYLLNVIPENELEYIYLNISQFVKILHKDEINTLKDIKKKYKDDKNNK